jgi:hypothetical protein
MLQLMDSNVNINLIQLNWQDDVHKSYNHDALDKQLAKDIEIHTNQFKMDAYDMDIDDPSSFDTQLNTSFVFVSQAKPLSQHAIATSQHPQTISIESQHEIMHSDWSIPMSLAPQRDLNSESDLNSYPFIQQLMLNQSNAANELSQSHLDLSGDLSATESDYGNFTLQVRVREGFCFRFCFRFRFCTVGLFL